MSDHFGVSVRGVTETIHNLELFGALLSANTAKALGAIVLHLLETSRELAPERSGKLVKDAKANLMFRGRYNYAIDLRTYADLSKVLKGRRLEKHGVTKLIGEVRYYRESRFGEDLALWLHEEVAPYRIIEQPPEYFVPTGPIAEHTGYTMRNKVSAQPKYLETPFLKHKESYVSAIQKNVSYQVIARLLKSYATVTQRKKSKYETDIIKMKKEMIEADSAVYLPNKLRTS